MTEESVLPSLQKVFVDWPLYQWFKKPDEVDDQDWSEFIDLIRNPRANTIDVYCLGCQLTGPFWGAEVQSTISLGPHNRDLWPNAFVVEFVCARKSEHRLHFLFKRDSVPGFPLMKIGQFPSKADLDEPGLRKYRKVLDNDRYRELVRGVGLVSHGVGIGAFVYLRRVLESLINEARDAAVAADRGFDRVTFDGVRFSEKIEKVAEYLPEFLVENHVIYGVLSKGVHELSEQECLVAFEPVLMAVELILDQKLAEKERKTKSEQAKAALSKLQNSLKVGNGSEPVADA